MHHLANTCAICAHNDPASEMRCVDTLMVLRLLYSCSIPSVSPFLVDCSYAYIFSQGVKVVRDGKYSFVHAQILKLHMINTCLPAHAVKTRDHEDVASRNSVSTPLLGSNGDGVILRVAHTNSCISTDLCCVDAPYRLFHFPLS
jgi:hypothetical protein